jgi:hypothetical protein
MAVPRVGPVTASAIVDQFALRPLIKVFGWLATAAMAVAAVGIFATWGIERTPKNHRI